MDAEKYADENRQVSMKRPAMSCQTSEATMDMEIRPRFKRLLTDSLAKPFGNKQVKINSDQYTMRDV